MPSLKTAKSADVAPLVLCETEQHCLRQFTTHTHTHTQRETSRTV